MGKWEQAWEKTHRPSFLLKNFVSFSCLLQRKLFTQKMEGHGQWLPEGVTPQDWEAGNPLCWILRKPLARWSFQFHNCMKLPIKNPPAVKQCELIYLLSIFTINGFRVSVKFSTHYFSLFFKHPLFMTLYTQSNNRNYPLIKPALYLSQALVCIYTCWLKKGLVAFALVPVTVIYSIHYSS